MPIGVGTSAVGFDAHTKGLGERAPKDVLVCTAMMEHG